MKDECIETTDIFRGAFLLCRGIDLADVTFASNGRHIATFHFTGQGLSDLDRQYRRGEALVDPLRFRESLNHLRDVLFKGLNERRRDDRSQDYRRDKARR